MSRRKLPNRASMIPDVTSRHSYVDSVAILMPRLLPKDAFRDLRVALARQRPKKVRTVIKKIACPPPFERAFHLVLWVHQPTVEAIEILKRAQHGMLYAVHVALDLEPATGTPASELQEYVVHRIQKKNGRPVKKSHWDHETVYLGGGQKVYRTPAGTVKVPNRRGTEIAIYSDKVSKVSGSPCTHIEYRATGASGLRQAEVATLDDVLSLNHRGFWMERIRLQQPPSRRRLQELAAERLGRWQKKADAEAVMPRHRRLSAAADYIDEEFDRLGLKDHRVTGTDILFFCRKAELLRNRRPNNLFKVEDPFWMLPQESGNALWIKPCVRRRRIKAL